MSKLNVRFNASSHTLRKVNQTKEGLSLYLEKQMIDIKHNFEQVINVLEGRKELLLAQVKSMVDALNVELEEDRQKAEIKKAAEGELMTKVRQLQGFVFAVEKKEHKRCMVKYKDVCEYEREFDRIDNAWTGHEFFVFARFRYPDDQFVMNLAAIRNFARGVGHFISEVKLARILERD